MNGTDIELKANYYALLVAICLNKTPSKALSMMGVANLSGISEEKEDKDT